MFRVQYLDKKIGEELLKENAKEREAHKSSGKLSASKLGWPLQWQILNWLGVPTDDIDEYVIRKMQRGNDVEKWVVKFLNPVEVQKYVEYRGVVGFIDAVADTSSWLPSYGVIPHEVKSVSNAKYKRIQREGGQRSHILQAVFYGLGLHTPHTAIHYVASDDYRVDTQMFNVEDFRGEIDEIIDSFERAKFLREIPKFEAKEDWQSNKEYANYKEFMDLEPADALNLLKDKYLIPYKKLMGETK